MLATPKKSEQDILAEELRVLASHSRQRALNRNRLMISPHPEEIFEAFFQRQAWSKHYSSVSGIFGEGEERQVSDICYSFIGFNDFM